MGANAQTSVPLFTAGDVLTAANQNLSAGTGVPVFATTTTRDAAFGGTGEKVLAEGQLCYIEASDVVQYYNGSTWATVGPATSGALTYVAGASFTSQTSVAFANSVFTSTYDNYIVQLNINAGTRTTFTMQVRDNSGTKSTAAYYGAWQGLGQNGTGGSATTNAATSFNMPQIEAAPYNSFAITVNLPADAAQQTRFHGTAVSMVTTAGLGNINFGGTYYVNEAHTGLVFTFGAASTGSYKVFGYANS